MVETYTPECDFNTKAHDFELKNTMVNFISLVSLWRQSNTYNVYLQSLPLCKIYNGAARR